MITQILFGLFLVATCIAQAPNTPTGIHYDTIAKKVVWDKPTRNDVYYNVFLANLTSGLLMCCDTIQPTNDYACTSMQNITYKNGYYGFNIVPFSADGGFGIGAWYRFGDIEKDQTGIDNIYNPTALFIMENCEYWRSKMIPTTTTKYVKYCSLAGPVIGSLIGGAILTLIGVVIGYVCWRKRETIYALYKRATGSYTPVSSNI